MLFKTSKYKLLIFLIFALVVNISCRKEEIEFEQAPPEDTLAPNSQVANLIQRTAMNDGSNSNIVDRSNCFNIQFPFTVIVNDVQIIVASDNDYDLIEDSFDAFDDDDDELVISFPIVIIRNDYSQLIINNYAEFYNYSNTCSGENEDDDDIECIDFQFPITASLFNANNELLQTVNITNDNSLYDFIDDLDEDDLVSINFPITLIVFDGTTLVVNNMEALEDTIDQYDDTCDEDDDYDYNDDDCNGCTPLQLNEILTNCSDWTVDKLERNDNNYDDAYDGYSFNFFTNGTIIADDFGTFYYGTWATSGTANNITVYINIMGLEYCNLNWNLHEIDHNSGETKVDLRVGDDDRMRYESNCN